MHGAAVPEFQQLLSAGRRVAPETDVYITTTPKHQPLTGQEGDEPSYQRVVGIAPQLAGLIKLKC